MHFEVGERVYFKLIAVANKYIEANRRDDAALQD